MTAASSRCGTVPHRASRDDAFDRWPEQGTDCLHPEKNYKSCCFALLFRLSTESSARPRRILRTTSQSKTSVLGEKQELPRPGDKIARRGHDGAGGRGDKEHAKTAEGKEKPRLPAAGVRPIRPTLGKGRPLDGIHVVFRCPLSHHSRDRPTGVRPRRQFDLLKPSSEAIVNVCTASLLLPSTWNVLWWERRKQDVHSSGSQPTFRLPYSSVLTLLTPRSDPYRQNTDAARRDSMHRSRGNTARLTSAVSFTSIPRQRGKTDAISFTLSFGKAKPFMATA